MSEGFPVTSDTEDGPLFLRCKHEVILKDGQFMWCAHCGLTRQRGDVPDIDYDD